MSLSAIIIQKILNDGPVSFHDFMEMSLYYPGLGYYTSERDKIGKNGDYCTSADYTFLFGEMIGKQLEEMWNILDKKAFTIVEYGAGTGSLCQDILGYLKNNKRLYDKLQYCIIEKSRVMREKGKIRLHEKVSWYDSIGDIPEITGCILSNEVIDNFSVHRVIMEDEPMEVFVDYNDDFIEVLKPASKELKDYFEQLRISLPKGFRTEINLEAIKWIKDSAAFLKRGYVMTIDYGYTSSELYHQSRRAGTITCYTRHQTNTDPYNNIGEQDITAHVNFSALNHWGLQNGLKCCGFTNQANFLHGIGLVEYLRKKEEIMKDHFQDHHKKVFLIHTPLTDMGTKFKMLVQQKGMQHQQLSGLKLAQQFV